MRALLLLTALALPIGDETPLEPHADSPIVVIPTAQFKQLLDDNLRLRGAVVEMQKDHDAMEKAIETCVKERSA